ncbi:hypothetical protein ACFLSP_02265 [Bacteroidota bacterium]
MKRVLPFIILLVCLSSCERQPVEVQKYDLFPLTVGNEFYYSFEESFQSDYTEIYKCTIIGNRQWEILSKSVKTDTSIDYNFQLIRYNMILYHRYFPQYRRDTFELEADTSFFKLIENPASGEIIFDPITSGWLITSGWVDPYEISVQRCSDAQRNDLEYNQMGQCLYCGDIHYGWYFAADSGLTGGNHSFYVKDTYIKYSCVLDSLNLIQ